MPSPAHELKGSVTRRLAQFVWSLRDVDLPKGVMAFAKVCILDLFGSALAARGTPIALAARNFTEEALGPGRATCWDTGKKASIVGATWVNSVLASAVDIDDGHRMAIGHPGSAIIPPTLAVAEQIRAHGRQLLEAVIAGYEIAIRVSHARDPKQIENVTTGAWGAFGAAIGAGKLILHSITEIENALGLAAMFGPRLPGTFPGGRRMVKEGIPWAAVAGVSSALLTRSGFTGPEKVFDFLPLYDPQRILQGLGKEFLILKTYFKRYPCCRWLHPIIEGLFSLMDEGSIQASQVKTLHIQTFSRAFSLPNRPRPETLEEAQFSIPFCSALAMTKKEEGFHHIRLSDLDDPMVIQLSERVRLEPQPGFDESFPEKILSKITIETSTKKMEKVVSSVKGDPDNPLTKEQLEEKYLLYASPVLGREKASLLKDYIWHLEEVSVEDLLRILTHRQEISP